MQPELGLQHYSKSPRSLSFVFAYHSHRDAYFIYLGIFSATQLVLKAHKEAVDSLSGSGSSTLWYCCNRCCSC